jgi:hypothetical protein
MEERYIESGADDGRTISQILRKRWKNGFSTLLYSYELIMANVREYNPLCHI